MPIDVYMTQLSPTMTEGKIVRWLKKEGDELTSGEVLCEVETDKATMEMEVVDEGVLHKILQPEGSVVPVGTPVTVTIAFAATDGFGSLNTSLTLTAPHLGMQQVDVLPRFFSPVAQRFRSADDTVRATSLLLPPLSVGTYTFDIAASNAAGSDSATFTVQVQ